MVEHDPGKEGINCVRDPVAFADACAVFGEEDAMERLAVFLDDLERHLCWIGQGAPDNETLRDMAHRIAGRAGVFGFPALMEAFVTLDEATAQKSGVAAALENWIEQARLAAMDISRS